MTQVDVPPEPTTATAPPIEAPSIKELVRGARSAFDSGRTRSYGWRRHQLEGIERGLERHEAEIAEALRADLGKPFFEAYGTEIGYLKSDVRYVLKHLRRWMKPRRVSAPLITQPGRARVMKEPLGVVLIIAPWNYPLHLALSPLIGALAAGNAAIVKPSEVAPHTSALVARLVPQWVDPRAVRVVEGGVAETTELLRERFDHIFYTGNGTVGRIVLRAAAEHLTPVTLELGGKSPAIVDCDVDLDMAARRLVMGKFTNAGQTCVAPDYALVHEDVYEPMVERLAATVREFYGADPQASDSYARIINERHHRRLCGLLDSGTPVVGGRVDEKDRFIAPTILRDVAEGAPIMKDEIFGPILPVLPTSSLDAAIAFVNARPKPLALYVFSRSKTAARDVLDRTSSGGALVNHTLLQLAPPELPFGGVGASGMGAYHGRASFDTFTHEKSVLLKPLALDPRMFYPPYRASAVKWIRQLL